MLIGESLGAGTASGRVPVVVTFAAQQVWQVHFPRGRRSEGGGRAIVGGLSWVRSGTRGRGLPLTSKDPAGEVALTLRAVRGRASNFFSAVKLSARATFER